MEATFEKSVAILEIAYLKGFLEPLSCAACACGNLLAAYNGYELVPAGARAYDGVEDAIKEFNWVNPDKTRAPLDPVFWKHAKHIYARFGQNVNMHQAPLDKAGYTLAQLDLIEQAFMREISYKSAYANGSITSNDGHYTSLLRVIDVLAVIHKVDLTVAIETRENFGAAKRLELQEVA